MKRIPNRYRSALAGALLLLPTTLLPQTKSKTPPAPALRGKFDVRLLVTTEPEKVFRPSSGPDGKISPAAPATVVERGRRVTAVLFIKDCKPNSADNCDVVVDLQGIDPSGKLFENRKAAELWRNKKAPAPGVAQLGSSKMNIQLEKTDPIGTYRVIAVARDRVAGTEVRSEASFQVK
jgi:hypothetical protein